MNKLMRHNVSLKEFTSLNVGGSAQHLVEVTDLDQLAQACDWTREQGLPVYILGHGTNSLVSDVGLPGTVLLMRSSKPAAVDGDLIIANAGATWDEVVQLAIAHNLWGVELMSGIPGGVGAAIIINITAYGERVSEILEWVEVYNLHTGSISRMSASDLGYDYKQSKLLEPDSPYVVIRGAFKLSDRSTKDLEYMSALKAAEDLQLKPDTLINRRKIILEARRRAGAIYDQTDPKHEHTAGSFFKNPLVSAEQAEELAQYEEHGISRAKVLEQNRIHGGEARRVSAAHVLLAAGFKRGQVWGPVRLHPQNVLKIENTGGASAQQIYDVAQEIIETVKSKLDIGLEPEVRFLGEFK